MNRFRKSSFILFILAILSLHACEDTWEERNVSGEVSTTRGFSYDILKDRGDYTIFLDALERAGYRYLVEGKGLSTLFAPSDVAFRRFFNRNGYSGLDDIPEKELVSMIGQHILRYSYSPDQLLNFQPRINLEEYPEGIYFRFQTVYQNGVETRYDLNTETDLKVYHLDKFLPVFNTNLFKSMGVKDMEGNYKYFFPKSNWLGDEDQIYPANAAVVEPGIPTDNGYLYLVDNVIEPLRTIYQVMDDTENDFSIMRDLYDRFPGYKLIDADWDDAYADGTHDNYWFFHYNTKNYILQSIGCEWTTDRPDWTLLPKVTYNGFVPNDAAMNTFFKEFWGSSELKEKYKSWDDLDNLIAYYLVKNHFLNLDGMVFPDMLREGLASDWGYAYNFNVDLHVNYKEICGNGVLYGLTKVEEPPLFESVARPAFQSPKYNLFAYMLDKSNLLPDLVNKERELTLFIPSNAILTAEGYNLNYGGKPFELERINVRQSSSTLSQENLELLVRNQIINKILSPSDLSNTTPVWVESDREDSYLKIGNGRIESEDGTVVYLGQETFNTNDRHGNWRAYEINGMLGGGSINNFYSLIGNVGKGYTSLLLNYRNNIIGNSDFDNGTGDLEPFRLARGLLFVTMDSWAIPGELGIPEIDPNEKFDMTEWLNKHTVGRDSDPSFNILDFLTGDVVGKKLQTKDEDFDISILNIEEVSSSYGTTKVTIRLPNSENNRTVEAYGPHFSKECIFYIITKASDRFVWGD